MISESFLAERGGFEPPVQFNPYDSLANYWFQPLTHLSVELKKNANIRQNDLISRYLLFFLKSSIESIAFCNVELVTFALTTLP